MNYRNFTSSGQTFSSTDPENFTTKICNVTETSNKTSLASRDQEIVIAVVILLLGVWSVLGNLLTIFAITMHKNMMTKCNYFILSLAVSDTLSAILASPLWVYRRTFGFYEWRWGRFLCKFFWGVDQSTSYCTALHIASFSVWRLTGVKWPQQFEVIKKRTVAMYLGLLWVLAIIFGGIVFSLFYDIEEKTSNSVSGCWPMCSIRIENNGVEEHKIYFTLSSAIFLLVPMAVLIVASALIVTELRNKDVAKSAQRKATESRAALQLGLIATSFVVGYIPLTVYVMWTTRKSTSTKSECLFDYWLNVGSYICLRFSECVNPLMYNIASKKMRKASLNILWKIRTCCQYKNKQVEIYNKESKKTATKAKPSSSPKIQVYSTANNVVACTDFLPDEKHKIEEKSMEEQKNCL